MTAKQAIDKLAAWMAANGVLQAPKVYEQTDFTPVVGFSPTVWVEWSSVTGKIQFDEDQLLAMVADNQEVNLRGVVLAPVQAILGVVAPLVPWSEWIKPPAPVTSPLEVVGEQVADAEVAMYISPDRPLLLPGRKYFRIANGAYPAEGSKFTAPGGSVYTVVAPTPFKRWLRL